MRASSFLLSGMLALCVAQASLADDKIVVVVPAILDPGAPIGEAVKRECAVETSVGNQIFQRVNERFPGTDQTSNPGHARPGAVVLKATLISVQGAGGGGWSGSKSITLRAEIFQDTKPVGSKILVRHSTGGVLGGVSGTCAIMDRIAGALGRDVTAWLPGALIAAKHEAASSDRSAAPSPKDAAPGPAASEQPTSAPK